MAFRFILLVLPALALASIYVEISGKYSGGAKDLNVNYNGEDHSIVSDTEINTFNLTIDNLKTGAHVCYGKRSDKIFIDNSWDGVHYQSRPFRVLEPKSGKILRVSTQSTMVGHQSFENNSTIPANINVGITKSISNTVSSSWSKGGELSVGENINYGINIFTQHLREPSFSYDSPWGKNTQQSQTITVGGSSYMAITLQPGQAIDVRLEATKESVQVEMKYKASIWGNVVFFYAEKHRGLHFLNKSFNASCMDRAKLNNHTTSREVIDIGFYSDYKVVFNDK